jgi:hypothetical protein
MDLCDDPNPSSPPIWASRLPPLLLSEGDRVPTAPRVRTGVVALVLSGFLQT